MAFTFRRSETIGLAAGAASGSLVFAALPLAVGAAITAFGDPAGGGVAAAVELIAMGVGSGLVSARLRMLPGRTSAIVAAFMLTFGHSLSAAAIAHRSWDVFLLARSIAGLGEGALYTVCSAFAAKSLRPDRAFTVVAAAQVLLNAVFFSSMAILNTTYDPVRVFALFAAFAAAMLPPLIAAPSCRTVDDGEPIEAAQAPFSAATRQVMLGFGIYSIALFMLFTFVEDIGVTAGFTHFQVAAVFALSTMAALSGPAISAFLGLRFGRLRPIFIAVGFQIAASLIIVHTRSLPLWAGAELASITLIYVLNPMMFGLAAHVDPTGRAAAMATVIMAMTAAAGPAASSAVLAVTSRYTAVGWCNAGAYVLMLAIMLRPLCSVDREVAKVRTSGGVSCPTP